MKTVQGWLSDPYVHVFVVGLILTRLAIGAASEDGRAEAKSRLKACAGCLQIHVFNVPCLPRIGDSSETVDPD